jgi:hypothetical protein
MTVRDITWNTFADPVRAAASAYSVQLRRELETIAGVRTSWSSTLPGTSAAPMKEDPVVLAARQAIEKLEAHPGDWPTIYATEADLLRIVDEETLRRRAWFIRDRFADVVGSEKAARYLASGAPDIKTGDVPALRADLLEVEREMAYHLTFRRQSERERARLLRTVSNLTLAIMVVFFSFLAWEKVEFVGKAVVTVIALAVLGIMSARSVIELRAKGEPKPKSNGGPPVAMLLLLILTLGAVSGSAHAATAPPADTSQNAAPAATGTAAKQNGAAEALSKRTRDAYTSARENAAGQDLTPNKTPSLAFAALAGLLGAAFSLLQRAQRSDATDPQVALFSFNEAGFHTYLISMLCGLISAVALYAVFAGNMLSGALFPSIVNGIEAQKGFAISTDRFLSMSGPATIADHAKLLVWAFIGGFSERFVPDVLDRFLSSAKK